jgi:hypothetical protein
MDKDGWPVEEGVVTGRYYDNEGIVHVATPKRSLGSKFRGGAAGAGAAVGNAVGNAGARLGKRASSNQNVPKNDPPVLLPFLGSGSGAEEQEDLSAQVEDGETIEEDWQAGEIINLQARGGEIESESI